MSAPGKPIVLHIGDPIRYNPQTYALLSEKFAVVRPSAAERERPEFVRALRERRWGDFAAIFRPFWGTGGEMGKWDDELISLLPSSVRVFASAGAGFDWADTEALGKRGIIYCNGGLAAAESVADFAVAMVIGTFRHLAWGIAAAVVPGAAGAAPAEAAAAFGFAHARMTAHSHNPRGRALGVVGMGRIGQLVARKLGHPESFGMRVHYHDVRRLPAAVERDGLHGAAWHPTLRSLLGASDCVVLCAPANPDGSPLVTAEVLAWLRPGARFVNVARGSLVDEDALADALEAGRVGAAALDVHADEPRVSPRLLRLAGAGLAAPGPAGGRLDDAAPGGGENPARVMLTCHNAGGTVETHIGFEELAMRNVLAVLGGESPITPVNLHYLPKTSKL